MAGKHGSRGAPRGRSAPVKRPIRRPPTRQQSNSTWFALAVGAIVLVGAGLVFVAKSERGAEREPPPGVQTFEVASANHVETPVPYPQMPPVGGDHSPVWQNCGFYPGRIQTESGVHTLEHGAVWITYDAGLPEEAVAAIRAVTEGDNYVLASAFDGLPSPVVASSWGAQLQLSTADDAALEQFVNAYRLSETTPEPGAPCTGGTGAVLP